MSAILKALKKLEKEPARGVRIRSLATTMDPTKVFKKPRKDRRVLRVVYLVVQVLILGGGVSLFGLYLLHNQARHPGAPGRDNNIVEEGTATLTTTKHDVTTQKLPLKESPVSGPDDRQTGIIMSESGLTDTDGNQEQTGIIKKKGMAAPATEDEAGKPATRIEIMPAGDVSQTGPTTAEPSALLPRLDYSILRLQAITWAVDPQDRFALVDDTILRKGESIKGFEVDSIQEDHIVVGKGGEKWRVEFRFR